MKIRRSSGQRLEDFSRAKLKEIFSFWVVNDLTNDFGLDLLIHLAEKESNEYHIIQYNCFLVQLRSSHKYKSHASEDLEVRLLLNYINHYIPVLVIKYYKDTDRFYWVIIQDYYLDILQKETDSWSKQHTKRVFLKNELNDIDEFKKKVISAQTRITEYQASKKRDEDGHLYEQGVLETLEISLRNPPLTIVSIKPFIEKIPELSDFLELFNHFANSILPGIQHGPTRNEVNFDLIILMKEKAERIFNLYNKETDQFHQDVNIDDDWIAQRAWFITGNFWFYLGEKIRAELHYEVLKSVNAVINPETNEPSYKESDLFFNLGVILYDLDIQESLKCFCRATQTDPRAPTPWFNKGYVLQTLDRHEEAICAYNKAVELNENYWKAWVNMGHSHAMIGLTEEALNAYDTALELDSDNRIALLNKGITLKEDDEFKEAIKVFNRAIKRYPDDSLFYVNRGLVFVKMKNFKKAIKEFDKALEVNPFEISAYINKGYSLGKDGRDQTALEIYEMGITKANQNVQLWFNKGVVLEKMKRFTEALISYDRVIDIDPTFVYAWNNKSSVLHQLGRIEESLFCLQLALSLDPDYFETVDELLVDQMKK